MNTVPPSMFLQRPKPQFGKMPLLRVSEACFLGRGRCAPVYNSVILQSTKQCARLRLRCTSDNSVTT